MSSAKDTAILNADRAAKTKRIRELIGNNDVEENAGDYRLLPVPLTEISEYTTNEIQNRLAIVEKQMRFAGYRKVSPQAALLMSSYEDECIFFLESVEKQMEIEAVHHVKKLWQLEKMHDRLTNAQLEANALREVQIIHACQWQQQARYGDYYPLYLKIFREQAKRAELRLNQILKTENFTTLAKKLANEEKFLKNRQEICPHRHPSTASFDDIKTLHSVWNAADRLGFDRNYAVEAIKEYGFRNETMHLDLFAKLANEGHVVIACMLHKDLMDIPRLYAEKQEQIAGETITHIIQALIDALFDTSFHPNDPRRWEPKAFLFKTRNDTLDKEAKIQANNKTEAEEAEAEEQSNKRKLSWCIRNSQNETPNDPDELIPLEKTQVNAAAKSAWKAFEEGEADDDLEKLKQVVFLQRRAADMLERFIKAFPS